MQETPCKVEIGESLKTLEQLIKDCTVTMESNSSILFVDTAKEVVMKKPAVPNYVKPTIPKFMIGSKPEKHTPDFFRRIKGTVFGAKSEQPFPGTSGASAAALALRRNPVITTMTFLGNRPNSIVRRKHGTVCICYCRISDLTLIDNTGTVTDVECDVNISDIAVHPSTDQLYCVYLFRKDVRSLDHNTGKTTKILDIEVQTQCIAVTTQDNFIIGVCNKPLLHIYSMNGHKIQTVPCVGYPFHLSECFSHLLFRVEGRELWCLMTSIIHYIRPTNFVLI